MKKFSYTLAAAGIGLATGWLLEAATKIDAKALVQGPNVFVDSADLKPGTFRKITVADLPKPYATKSSANFGAPIPRPAGAMPKVLPGFKVELYTSDVKAPRQIRMAPNGDFFIAESNGGVIKVIRPGKDGKPEQVSEFAKGLTRPYGINFYPAGANPQWVYVGNTGSVMRFAYKNGDLKASSAPETLVNDLQPGGNHWTRDVVFSKDGKRMFVAVGSTDNIGQTGNNEKRANILEFTPEGKYVGIYASGIRNPAGLGVNPETGEVWCSVNERDELGDNLVPDYITHVKEGGFYGWPWFYLGQNEDPRLAGQHPEMKDKAIVPDILLQPHNASLGLTFYDGKQFPEEYRGDLFAAEHGSWNRANRSGYEVVRVPLEKGHASGVYEDFMTGFVTADGKAWGRPVGVVTGKDGSLYVTDDGSNSVWRISWLGK
ncbi:MAG TPA: sorbosone dehydrogenase family protein [Bryobacteraceae bacterium]|nr:sorbosone dehydrogenase family protein [Bryobacteraceae bacterium]